MRVLTLVGARPQFVKASMLSRALSHLEIEELLVHSGQHYDERVSQIFFEDLGIPEPITNLEIGSGSHAKQTGDIMIGLESFLKSVSPLSCLIAYGDTNTTLAGALVAAKNGIPLVHIEAGLRSGKRSMPEEINRIITDRLSALLFCPTQTALNNLAHEGIKGTSFLSGDVMYDATMHFSSLANNKKFEELSALINDQPFFLTTVHRPSNTDDMAKLHSILNALSELDHPVIFPVHPRTKVKLGTYPLPDQIRIVPPVGYLQMLFLIQKALAVITDSGGVQKEAYWLKKPCITLRKETEWTETLEGGWNKLVGADPISIKKAVREIPSKNTPRIPFGSLDTGEGASSYIARKIKAYFGNRK